MRWASLLLALPFAALAACPEGGQPLAGSLPAEARRLEALAAQCESHPGYLAWRGAVLLGLGRAREAADLLERALLLAPDHQGARLDYARALAALGEAEAAGELLGAIAARPDLPPAVREFLAVSPEPTFLSGWRQGGSLSVRLGYDDNLNRATRAGSLALTLPGGALVLPLAPEARAQAGGYVQARGELFARRGLGAGAAIELLGDFEARRRPDRPEQAQAQANLAALWRRPAAEGGEWAGQLGVSELSWEGATLQRAWRLGLRRGGRDARCRPWAGGDLEARRHPAAPELDHHYLQLHGAWVCDGARPWVAHLALGREMGAARPGGDAWRLAGRWLAWLPLEAGARLEAEARLYWRREDGGYSPLLESGARLESWGGLLRLDWRRPLGGAWEFVAGIELERQAANLPLFALARHAVSLGLAWRW